MTEEKKGQVIDLASFRKRSVSPEFSDRLCRIRASLEKINKFFAELKKISSQPPPANWEGHR